MIISCSYLLRTRNVSDKSCGGNQNTHFVFSFFSNRAVYEKMRKNIVERGRSQTKIWHMPLHAGYLRLQMHTLKLCNIYCFTPATKNVPQCYLIRTLPVLLRNSVYILNKKKMSLSTQARNSDLFASLFDSLRLSSKAMFNLLKPNDIYIYIYMCVCVCVVLQR